jgi:hypothetical protein
MTTVTWIRYNIILRGLSLESLHPFAHGNHDPIPDDRFHRFLGLFGILFAFRSSDGSF